MTPKVARAIGATQSDEVFEALAHDRRRHAFYVIRDAAARISLTDLAIAVARRTSDETEQGVDCEKVEQIRRTLYHWHVPKLAEAGLAEYDTDQNMVEPTERITRVDDVAELLAPHDR